MRNILFKSIFFSGLILICIIFLPSLLLPKKITLFGGKLFGYWSSFCLKIFYSTSRISGYDWITEKWRWPSDSCEYLLLNGFWFARTGCKLKSKEWIEWMLSDWISARCEFARFQIGRFALRCSFRETGLQRPSCFLFSVSSMFLILQPTRSL